MKATSIAFCFYVADSRVSIKHRCVTHLYLQLINSAERTVASSSFFQVFLSAFVILAAAAVLLLCLI